MLLDAITGALSVFLVHYVKHSWKFLSLVAEGCVNPNSVDQTRVGMNSENPTVKRPQMDLGMSPVIFYLHRSCRQTGEEKKEGCWRVVRGPGFLGLRS